MNFDNEIVRCFSDKNSNLNEQYDPIQGQTNYYYPFVNQITNQKILKRKRSFEKNTFYNNQLIEEKNCSSNLSSNQQISLFQNKTFSFNDTIDLNNLSNELTSIVEKTNYGQSGSNSDEMNKVDYTNTPSTSNFLCNASTTDKNINLSENLNSNVFSNDFSKNNSGFFFIKNQSKTNLGSKTQCESNDLNNISQSVLSLNEWIQQISNQVIQDMNNCGICVIDNFLSTSHSNFILNEVKNLYDNGYFKDGLLVNAKSNHGANQKIRGDKIHWVEGKEPECKNIGDLMRILDKIITNSTRYSKNKLENCNIINRTKAMIACYPGNGTKYVKHVDNANQDGRRITCIYYLNKNWDSQKDGGLLRIFPRVVPGCVANIAPLFNRIIFFWSDRRNPHEVMPAYSIRFAITLWYFDAEERERHINQYQNTLTQN